jgi:serine protease AprX
MWWSRRAPTCRLRVDHRSNAFQAIARSLAAANITRTGDDLHLGGQVLLALGITGEMTGQMGDTARRLSTAFFALALLIAALPGTSWTAPIDPALGAGDYALIQVAHGTADAVAARATAAGATDVAALDNLDIVTARVSTDALGALSRDARVAVIASDAPVVSVGRGDHFEKGIAKPSAGIDVVNAQQAWPTATGRGVTVAVMDTGIGDEPDLRGSVVARVDFVNDGATMPDPSGHGTFVAGLIAAHGRDFKGVAPDAKLVSLRVLDVNGRGTMHSVLAAFDWILQNRAKYDISVLNLSFGAPQKTTYHRELLAGVVESAWFAGVTVVAAAGNAGPAAGTILMPGADPFVVTVGSLADQGTVAPADDRESLFSSRGPTRDGFTKPDVLAPGEHVVSLRVAGSAMDIAGPEQGSSYARLSGTSASTAIAAGVAALVAEAHERYSPTQIKGAIVAGARRVTGTRTPAVDAADALTAHPARVNVGVLPSLVLMALLAKSGASFSTGISWEGISWEGISWESVSWEGVAWEAVSWEGVTWDSMAWEQR